MGSTGAVRKVLISSADGDFIDDVHGELAPGRTEPAHRIEQSDRNLWRQIREEPFRQPGGRNRWPKAGRCERSWPVWVSEVDS